MYKEAITKWMYWIWNFESDFVKTVFGDEGEWMVKHLQAKFNYAYERYGAYGCIPAFVGELDKNHREKLIDWVMDNFKG